VGAGLQIIDFKCHKDSPSVADLMHDIRTPTLLEYGTKFWDSDNLRLIDSSLIRFCEAWGKPYGFIQEQDGAIVQNLFPIKKNESEQISSLSLATLEMHTETAFHPWRPQYVILLCVRGDERAETTYAILDDILYGLDQETIDILHQPMFTTTLDKSFQNLNQKDSLIKTAVFFNNGTSMAYDRVLMNGLNTDANHALQVLSSAIESCKQAFVLSTGNIAIIENWKVVHGKTPFVPNYDGNDRWLKRVMVRRSMPHQHDIYQIADKEHYIVKTTF
jgi:alpha-ketoglutarate-dependent taurine dioxygenase